MKEKYMILCVAGQSNAVGYDESPVTADDPASLDRERIAQLGLYGEDSLRVNTTAATRRDTGAALRR